MTLPPGSYPVAGGAARAEVGDPPRRILFVVSRLESGGEQATVRLLAQALDRTKYVIDVVVCRRTEGPLDQAHPRVEAIGVRIDRTPCDLSFKDTVAYLAGLMPGYDVVVSGQDVAAITPALDRLHLRPALVEHGQVGSDALVARRWERLFDAIPRRAPAPAPSLFRSFWQGGFECSSHRRAHDGRRIDVIAATGHDALAESDYRLLGTLGVRTVRDGLRWHLIERTPGHYDWSSLDDQLAGAAAARTEVIWDLLHYGWPDDIDVWSAAFVTRFAAFAAAATRVIRRATPGTRFYCPVNEISFLSWGGGDVAYLNPFARGRGFELKVQLARAAIAATEAIRRDDPEARFAHIDPIINIISDPAREHEAPRAEAYRLAQFQGWDLIAGRLLPDIGGRPDLLDIVGVNYYRDNQWLHRGRPIDRHHPRHKPFHRLLAETYARYGRPMFIAETGIEGDARPEWLAHIADEVRAARRLGVPVEGLCLYPVLDHPGWDDDRHCPNGLIRALAGGGGRAVNEELAEELARQQAILDQASRAPSPSRQPGLMAAATP